MCFLHLWTKLTQSPKSRKRFLEMGLGIVLVILWLLGTSALVGLFLIYANFRSQEIDDDNNNLAPPPPDYPQFASCASIINGSFNASSFPTGKVPLILCEGAPGPLVIHTFGGDVQNTTMAQATWVQVRSTMVVTAMAKFEANFDATGSSSGFITLRTPLPVTAVQHRGSGTVEITSGATFWLCPAQVISEGTFMAITYYCGNTGAKNQLKLATVAYTIMLET
jgi:hypothetical protein